MSRCDLFNEFSCRFCLGNAQNGSLISNPHFLVERRIITTEEIFSLTNLRVATAPNVPDRICDECQKTIIAFYSLKKSFQENEEVLFGKIDEDLSSESPLPIVKEFLKENADKCLQISKYTDKLSIEIREIAEEDDSMKAKKVNIVILERPADAAPTCSKCLDNFSLVDVNKFDVNEDSNLDQPSNEEYLEEDVLNNDESTYDSIPPDIQQFEIKEEPCDSNQWPCMYCEKTFASRSGRDTHQQIKHKCPEDFDPNSFVTHEQEIEADGKPCIVWKCPLCSHYSKKKDHHRTHMIRHAIRDSIKQEIDSGFVIENEDSQDEKIIYAVEEEKSLENFDAIATSAPLGAKVQPNDCRLLKSSEENLFFCSECFSKFPSEETGNFHCQKFGSTGLCTTCICNDCNVIFPSMKLLKRHQGYHAITGVAHCLNYFECLTCSLIFSNKHDLDEHLKLHVGLPQEKNERYQYQSDHNTKLDGCELQLQNLNEEWLGFGRLRCGYCSKVAERNEMNLHMTFFHANLICPFDNQQFSRSVGYFVDHLKSKHPDEFKGVEVSFKCPFCEGNYSSLTAMKAHCKTCQEKRFNCSHCDKKFFTDRQLKNHLMQIEKAKTHKCPTCDKSFISKTELNVHSRMHTNAKPYPCTFPGCEKAFRTNSHRSSHMDTHSTSENYQCSHCEHRFKTRGARRIHEKTHTGVAASKCTLCPKEFRQRSHLIRHVKLVHRIDCNSANLEESIGTQIQKVGSSTVDASSNEDSNQ